MATVEIHLELWQVEAIAKNLAAAGAHATFADFLSTLPKDVADAIYQKWEVENNDEDDYGDDDEDELEEDEDRLEFVNFVTGQTLQPQDWQRSLKIGDYYAIEPPIAAVGTPGNFQTFDNLLVIYGHIESNEDCDPSFFWARGYSQRCPNGELGLLNICEPTRQLTVEEFNQAKASGWPSTIDEA